MIRKGPAKSTTSDMPKAKAAPATKAPPPKTSMAARSPAPDTEAHWKARDAMRTLQEAERVRADPKLHAAAKAMASQEASALKKIAGRK